MAKNPNRNPMRTFYRSPTKAATKAEEAKQNGRILRFRKKANELMRQGKRKEAEKEMFKALRVMGVTMTAGAAKKANKKPRKRATKSGGLGFRPVDDLLNGIGGLFK